MTSRARRAPSRPSSAAISRVRQSLGSSEIPGNLIFVQHFINLGNIHPCVESRIAVYARIGVAATCTHYQTFDRRETHTGIDGFAVLTAVMDAPLPKWAIIMRMSSRGLPKMRAASGRRNAYRHRGNRSGGRRIFAQFARHGISVGRSGMVWWNEVSITPTLGRLGKCSCAARMPLMLAGLCSGANGMQAFSSSRTSWSMRTDS